MRGEAIKRKGAEAGPGEATVVGDEKEEEWIHLVQIDTEEISKKKNG